MSEPGGGVRLCGGGDVGALRVDNHEQTTLARCVADALTRRQPVPAERLEERDLWLDGRRERMDGVDQFHAVPLHGAGVSAAVSTEAAVDVIGERRTRIEPDAQDGGDRLHPGDKSVGKPVLHDGKPTARRPGPGQCRRDPVRSTGRCGVPRPEHGTRPPSATAHRGGGPRPR